MEGEKLMETVKVIVKGAGSLEVEGLMEAKAVYSAIREFLVDVADQDMTVREIKRGPKKKVKEAAK